jgi:hypothetical protein
MSKFEAGDLVRVLYTEESGEWSEPVRVKTVYGDHGETELEEQVFGNRYWNQDDLHPVRLLHVLPDDFDGMSYPKLVPHLAKRVIDIIDWQDDRGWPGPQRNVHNWWMLEDGSAVGFNENPSRGWSFPRITLKAT